jgi:hypothetical protein
MDYFKSIPTQMVRNFRQPLGLFLIRTYYFQDYDGQARAENLSRIIVVLFGVVGIGFGWVIQQFSQTVYILGAGLVFAAIVSTRQIEPASLKPSRRGVDSL